MVKPIDFHFDEGAVELYTNGFCHALALALHERTGWPLVAIWGMEGRRPCLAHVAVEHPRSPNAIVDVRGVRDLGDAMADYWDLTDPWSENVTPGDIQKWIEIDDILATVHLDDRAGVSRVADEILHLMAASGEAMPARPSQARQGDSR